MGGVVTKNKAFRCEQCFQIYNITISPGYPDSIVYLLCNCKGQKEVKLDVFMKDIKAKKPFVIHCANCKKESPKSFYCYDCKKVYCSNCVKNHSKKEEPKKLNQTPAAQNPETAEQTPDNTSEQSTPQNEQPAEPAISVEKEQKPSNEKKETVVHRIIDINKYDFYCVNHPNNTFNGYCYKCKENICKECISKNNHDGHNIESFSTLLMNKKEKEALQNSLKFANLKIEYNSKVSQMIIRDAKGKIKPNELSDLSKLAEINDATNKNIYELINNYIIVMLEKIKDKNYVIIQNLARNNRFNIERLKFEKKSKIEEDAELLSKYLKSKNGFILYKPKLKKKPVAVTNTALAFSEKPIEEVKQNEDVCGIIENKTITVIKKKKMKKKVLEL